MYVCAATEEWSEEFFQLPLNCTVNQTGNILGNGSYGEVVEVEYKGRIYAAKKYKHVEAEGQNSRAQEHEIMASIRHPNIVTYCGIRGLTGNDETVIVMEKMLMNLSKFLEDVNITLVKKFKILHNVAEGLHYLHTQNPAIIHGDLTATNILLNSRYVAKIGDFGNSRKVDLSSVAPELLSSNPGTLDYMPPEALEGAYNEKLDIFSFGHLSIYAMIQYRPHPLLRPTKRERGKLIPRTEVERRCVYTQEVISKLGGEEHSFFLIIIACLQDEPDNRPSCSEILEVLATHINN